MNYLMHYWDEPEPWVGRIAVGVGAGNALRIDVIEEKSRIQAAQCWAILV